MRRPLTVCAAGVGWFALASVSAAQSGISGSESHISPARNLPAAGARATSENFVAETEVASPQGGPASQSETYRFRGSATWSGSDLDAPGPLVFGVATAQGTSPIGDPGGGDPEILLGLGFQAPGSGVNTATIAGQSTGVAVALSDTELLVVTPSGTNAIGNPLARVDVGVSNSLGSSAAPDAYTYGPALVTEAPPKIGETFKLHLYGAPGALVDGFVGLSFPGISVPISPLGGAFDLALYFESPVSSAFLVTDTHTWALPIPNKTNLVGKTVEWQGYALSSLAPLAGSFTNRIATTFTD